MKRTLFNTLLLAALLCAATPLCAATDDDGMQAAQDALLQPAKPANAQAVQLRDTRITAKRMEYNYKEAVATMTDDVVVDDARFLLTADRLFVFLDGTNSFSQLVVMGHVAVSNENRRAWCDKAVYTKADARLVMVGKAKLTNIGDDGKRNSVKGDKITIWTTDQRMEVYPNPELNLAPGSSNGLKDMIK